MDCNDDADDNYDDDDENDNNDDDDEEQESHDNGTGRIVVDVRNTIGTVKQVVVYQVVRYAGGGRVYVYILLDLFIGFVGGGKRQKVANYLRNRCRNDKIK